MKTDHSQQPVHRGQYDQKESRYMTTDKKHYYLASVDENVQVLLNQQKEELTRVLIELKSQLDVIQRETSQKKKETEELCKKITMLQKMDEKDKKKIEDSNHTADTMKWAIDLKKQKLQEENYQKKTLTMQIEKYKNDILLTKKDIVSKENESRILSKQMAKERHKETMLKDQKNQIYSKITTQEKKNKFDQNEQDLQIQYYKTIIEQKNAFIRSADERKERQQKIAQEAKNDSQDKQEIELRKTIGYLSLYNKYLRTKMEQELARNEKLEETYQKVRDICGTSNLRIMVETMLEKEKRYNECVVRVSEYEKKIDTLDADLKELETELTQLKTDVLVKENNDYRNTVSPMPVSIISEDQNALIKQEIDLKRELNLLQEKNKNISLVYEKIILNMKNLYASLNSENKPNDSVHILSDNNTSTNDINTTNIVCTEANNAVDSIVTKKNFDEFLVETKKKFDALFLCYTKQDFLNMMQEKGVQEQNYPKTLKKKLTKKPQGQTQTQTQQATTTYSKPTDMNEGDEMEVEEETYESEDRDIFDTFQRDQRNKVEGFIKKEAKKR